MPITRTPSGDAFRIRAVRTIPNVAPLPANSGSGRNEAAGAREEALIGWAVVMTLGFGWWALSKDEGPAPVGSGDRQYPFGREASHTPAPTCRYRCPAKQEVLQRVSADLAEREKGLIQADTAAQAQAQLLQILRKIAKSADATDRSPQQRDRARSKPLRRQVWRSDSLAELRVSYRSTGQSPVGPDGAEGNHRRERYAHRRREPEGKDRCRCASLFPAWSAVSWFPTRRARLVMRRKLWLLDLFLLICRRN